MEYLDSSVDIYALENKKISIEEAASKSYLDLTESISYLNGLGACLDLKIFMRYLLGNKITPYTWFSSYHVGIKLESISEYSSDFKYYLNEDPDYINQFIVNKGYVEIHECKYIFSENPEGKFKVNDKFVDILVSIFLAESSVINILSGFKVKFSWRPQPQDKELLKKIYFKVSDLNSIAKFILDSAEHARGLLLRSDDNLLNDLKENIKSLESENSFLKEKLNFNTKNSDYVIGGALIELLTEQKSPRRNQSTLKLELVEQKLKGMSQGSLNDFFAAANKALKASKDEG